MFSIFASSLTTNYSFATTTSFSILVVGFPVHSTPIITSVDHHSRRRVLLFELRLAVHLKVDLGVSYYLFNSIYLLLIFDASAMLIVTTFLVIIIFLH